MDRDYRALGRQTYNRTWKAASLMPFDIVVPDLLLASGAPPAMRGTRLPKLERWLARADLAWANLEGSHAWIAAEHGLAPPVPYAAIALEGEGLGAEGDWLRADPVYLRIDQDGVVLHDAAILDMTRDEADALARALQAHFAGDGIDFRVAAPERWYLRVPPGESPVTVPLERAFGRNVFGLLPRGAGRINWPSALTEAQMTLASHEVNTRRTPAKLAVNSVWFWGEGPRPASLAQRYGTIHADDAVSLGFAKISGGQARSLPAGIAGTEIASQASPTLVAIDALTKAMRRGDEAQWIQAAAQLDERWFSGLGAAIARFGAVRIVLPTEARTLVATLTPAARWRWWRLRKPMAAHA